ncbi:MAG TPA: response regulator [Caulobacterales bacterium]|nr:response regulator [Caulobacterales bacterium]
MTESIRVLVVDDSEDDRALYRRELKKASPGLYDVLEAADGEHGLALADHNQVRCILLDYSLPGRNGVEVLKRIKARHPFMPVVMLTGMGNESVAVSAMQAGAQNYIVKSTITSEEIDRAVQLAIAHCDMERRIEEQRMSLEIFTRALAHDLKEPVRTIKSFISVLMSQEPLSPDGRRYFGYVHDAADRMAALIDAVYHYTRLDSSAQPLTKEMCELGEVLKGAEIDLAELIREREATITVAPLPIAYGNASQIRQVFQNLLSNAIRHCPHDPEIRVDAKERPDCWEIRVADNGVGIEPEQRQRIFEPFIRLHHYKADGLGMGLAICKRIVEGHGGRIWCEVSEKEGAAFVFTLPKEVRPDVGREAPKAAPRPKRGQTPDTDRPLARILVVDDNEAAIELTRIVLIESSKLRCELISARGGEEALTVLDEAVKSGGVIDLVLLDINMPRISGFDLLQRIRADDRLRDVAVVMCTTSGYDKDVERARDLGAAGFVTKPATLKNLRPVLESVGNVCLSEANGVCALLRVA